MPGLRTDDLYCHVTTCVNTKEYFFLHGMVSVKLINNNVGEKNKMRSGPLNNNQRYYR